MDDEVGETSKAYEREKGRRSAPFSMKYGPRALRSAFDGLSDLGGFGDLNRIGFRSAVGRR